MGAITSPTSPRSGSGWAGRRSGRILEVVAGPAASWMPEAMDRAAEEDLLSRVAWIRSLARRLVAGAEQADDLAQEAVLAALEHGPRPDGSTASRKGWWATVLRNKAREHGRATARRAAREQRAA